MRLQGAQDATPAILAPSKPRMLGSSGLGHNLPTLKLELSVDTSDQDVTNKADIWKNEEKELIQEILFRLLPNTF